MSHDNPSPEMIQARKAVLDRRDEAHKKAAEAWQKVRDAYDAIGASTAQMGGAEREELYVVLSEAQAAFKIAYGAYETTHEAAREYFQPIAPGASGI